MSRRDTFALHYDCEMGYHAGWRVTFRLDEYPVARKGRKIVRDLTKISAILPRDDWPEFAKKDFRQRVENENIDERLF